MTIGRPILLCMTLWAAVLLQGFAAAPSPQSLEYPVKASYLVRFAAFVDWPGHAFASQQAPVTICVVGRDPFGALLDRTAATQTAHGRRLAVRRPVSAAGLEDCHIAYLGPGAPTASIQALNAAPSVLTVTDSAASARRGMINFVVSENRVRFQVDLEAATRDGLSISSRLLNLALSVRGG